MVLLLSLPLLSFPAVISCKYAQFGACGEIKTTESPNGLGQTEGSQKCKLRTSNKKHFRLLLYRLGGFSNLAPPYQGARSTDPGNFLLVFILFYDVDGLFNITENKIAMTVVSLQAGISVTTMRPGSSLRMLEAAHVHVIGP